MEWFLLALNVALSGSSAIALKFYQKKNGMGAVSAYLFTAIMTGTIALVSIFVAKFSLANNPTALLLSVVMGLLYAVNIPMYGKALTLGSVGLCGVFLNLGSLLLPFIYGVAFLGEGRGIEEIFKWFGLAFALSAVLLQIPVAPKGESTQKEKPSLAFFLLGLGSLLANGCFCVLLKVQAVIPNPATNAQVMFFAGLSGSVLSFAALGVYLLLQKYKRPSNCTASAEDSTPQPQTAFPAPKTLLFAVVYGAFNGTMNLLNLIIATKIPAAVHFAVLSCGGLLLMAILGIVLFKDKFTKKTAVTLLLASASIVFFAL
jgi:multidrug transporter EmrE-like cation transporter